jgi:hypothetical protein
MLHGGQTSLEVPCCNEWTIKLTSPDFDESLFRLLHWQHLNFVCTFVQMLLIEDLGAIRKTLIRIFVLVYFCF